MEKTGNSVQLNDSEKKILKKLIDRKYGKLTTSIDFESTGGLHDYGIEEDIDKHIGKNLSGSTIERMIGLTRDQRKVRISSLEILSEYLDFKSSNQLLAYLENYLTKPKFERDIFEVSTFIKNHILKIVFGENKEISIRNLEKNKFEVVFSKNSKLLKGDNIELNQLELDEELFCGCVFRIIEKKTNKLGPYKSGENNMVKSMILSK